MELFENIGTPCVLEQESNPACDDIVKDFLLNVLLGDTEYDNFKVISMQGASSPITRFLNHHIDFDWSPSNTRTFNECYTVSEVLLNDFEYTITFLKIYTRAPDFPNKYLEKRGFIAGYHQIQLKEKKWRQNCDVSPLIRFLNAEVIIKSSLKNKILQYNRNEDGLLSSFSFMKLSETKKENIFVPLLVQNQLSRFINSILQYQSLNTSLRYLFNGEPGTGKTQLINSILNEIDGKITTIVIRETDFPMKAIFEFAELFEPCLLVLDDLDLILKERDLSSSTEKSNLSTFLQYLDGLLPKSIFVLATTNDKTLVDKAASRPGRFDLIMDVGEIKPQNYFDLINRETDDKNILEFFTENVLLNLAEKRITGAFLVNLIKQFKNIKLTSGKISSDEMKEYLDFSFRGFYKTNIPQTASGFGFGVKSNEKLVLNKND